MQEFNREFVLKSMRKDINFNARKGNNTITVVISQGGTAGKKILEITESCGI